ncbi:HD domain-containing protein [Flavihumibacter sp. R14]|nr:HD domain-containing protein [Flavihumibacter soli]
MDEFEKVKSIVLERLSGLNTNLTYHCLDHTLDVVQQSERIAGEENIANCRDLYLLKVAALYHDTGFLETYANHELKSCEIFLADSENFDLSIQEKSIITNLIMATQIPQLPATLLEKIICDADLDYLGRDDFFSIGDNLRREFLSYNIVANDEQWEQLQIKFLQKHQYHTESSQKLREPNKQMNFAKL